MCKCVPEVNKQLAKLGFKLKQELRLDMAKRKGTASKPLLELTRLPGVSRKTKAISLECAYCPFCGKDYEKKSK